MRFVKEKIRHSIILFLKSFDLGDFIGIKGHVFKTKVGETSIMVKSLYLLSKSLKPLPVVKESDGKVYDAFANTDMKYRQRYVDLVVNLKLKNLCFKIKADEFNS